MRLFNILELFIFPSILVLILVLIKPLLKNRVKPAIRYALWLLVVIRMVLPVAFPSVPLMAINPSSADSEIAGEIGKLPPDTPFTPSTEYDDDTTAADILEGQKTTLLTNGHALSLRGFWIIGSVIMFLFFLIIRISFFLKVRNYKTRYECDSKIPVYIMDNRRDCFMFGFFSKKIYIGQDLINNGQVDFVIAHYSSHSKQLDNIWLLVRILLLTVYWFHPAVWIAASHAVKDGEYACNMLTVKTIGEDKYPEYKEFVIGLSRIMPRPVFWEQFVYVA